MPRQLFTNESQDTPRLMKWASALLPSLPIVAGWQVFAELNGYGNGYTDITRDVTDTTMRTQRGFQSSAPDDLLAAPGQWTFGLDNSKNNSGGVAGYYALDSTGCRSGWQTNIRIKLVLSVGGRLWTRFVGFLETVQPLAGKFDDQIVDVLVVGWLNQAATTSIATLGAAVGQRGDQLMSLLLAMVNRQPTSTTFAVGLQTYPYAFDDLNPQSSTIINGIDSTVRSGFDRVYEGADGGLVFESRRLRQTTAPAVLTLSDVAPAGFPSLALTSLSLTRARQTQYNGVTVTVHPGNVDASPVTLYSLPISASNPSIDPMLTIPLQCPYVDPNQQAQQIGGFNMLISNGAGGSVIGTNGLLPTADYQFTTGPGGTGVDMSAFVSVSVVYGANAAVITVTNNDPTRTAYFNLLRCRGQGIYKYQVVQATQAFSAAQTQQGQNFLSLDCPYCADPFLAQSAAIYFGGQLSQRISQIDQISIYVPATDVASMLALLALDISTSIAITETQTGMTAGLYWINSEAMEIDHRGNITFTYGVSPNVGSSRWQLGVNASSELGIDTDLGF